MVDNKNKGSGEFDDDGFEVDDFSDAEFDEAAYDESTEFDELPDAEGDYEGEDFESEDWGDEEPEQTTGKKDKKAKKVKSGDSKLGFNTIVIIGAVIVGGGVMAYKIMSETNEMKAAQPSLFRSILNIGGIMDGTIFGDKAEETEQADAQTSPLNEGFLNDPSSVPTAPEGAPPQPTPIAPADGTIAANEPLTPMPVPPSVEAPRGPDDVPPVESMPATVPPPETVAEAPPASETPTPAPGAPAASAEDILKQAMANREQKQQTNDAVPPTAPPAIPVMDTVKEDVPPAAAPDVAEVTPAPEATSVAEQPPAPVQEAVVSEEAQKEIAANKDAVTALEGRIDTLLKRMDQIENDLGAVQKSKSDSNTEQLEKTVASLRTEIEELKSRPAASPPQEETAKPAPQKKKPVVIEDEDTVTASEPKPAPVKKTAAKAKPAPQAAASASRWELRAAQPGRAWVSKPGERDMQAISVGETLSGIGRISAITYQNGRWTVTGSQGAIHQ